MFSQDRNQSLSFDFFKKRKKSNRNQNGDLPANSLSESILNLHSRNGSNNRRNSFRGVLNDNHTKGVHDSNNNTKNNTPDDDFDTTPTTPFIDTNLCKAINYITWVRDQMVFGNEQIISIPSLEKDYLTLMEEMKLETNRGKSIINCVIEVIYNRMVDIYKSYNYLLNNSSQYCHLSTIYLNSFLFVRPIDFSLFDFSTNTSNHTLTLPGHEVNGPVFIQGNLLPFFNKACEFLPSKFSYEYVYKQVSVENDYLPNLITKVTYQRAVRQLVVVKALLDLPAIDLNSFEGYIVEGLKTGEKAWLPIYISERLSHHGYLVIELPSFLTKTSLKELKRSEHKSTKLEKLPSDYFFEIAYFFTKAKMFKKIYVPNLVNHSKMYNYVSKITGIIEDIKYSRIRKIHNFLESLNTSDSIIQLENFQYSETYFINQFLSGYCSFEDKKKKLNNQPWMQIDHLIGDLENTLLDSIKQQTLI